MKKHLFSFLMLAFLCLSVNAQPSLEVLSGTYNSSINTGDYETVSVVVQNDGASSTFDFECDFLTSSGGFITTIGKSCSVYISSGGSATININSSSNDANPINSSAGTYSMQIIALFTSCFQCGGYTCPIDYISEGNSITVTEPCSNWSISPISANYPATGGSGSFTIYSSGTCNFTTTSDSWIHVTYPNYTVDPNTTCSSQTGYIFVYDDADNLQTWLTITEAGLIAPTTPTISGNTSFCQGQSTTLSVTSPCSGCTYNWSNGGSGTSISVNNAGTYTATATNSCGSSSPSNSLNVTVTPTPTTPTISGNTSFCSGQSTNLSVTNPCSGCTYTWSPSGSGTSITVTNAGTYTATAHNSCGSSNASNSLNVTVNIAPTTPTISAQGGITSFCQGTGSAILQVSSPCTGCTYTWSPSGSGTSITVVNAGTYTCTATNSCGTSQQSNSITITVYTVPIVSFTYNGSGCIYNFTDQSTNIPPLLSWIWHFGDQSPNISTQNPQHTFPGNGTYTVSLQATNECGSSSSSQTITVTNCGNGIDEYKSTNIKNISIIPNPISNSALIKFSIVKSGKISINLFDILGKKIYTISESDYNPGDYSIPFNKPENLSSGTYFIKFDSDEYSEKLKVVFN